MRKISEELEQQLKSMPNRMVDLIVRTQGSADPHLAWMASAGIEVRQQYRLSPGVAVTCSGSDALKLLNQDWVISVEKDEAVHTM